MSGCAVSTSRAPGAIKACSDGGAGCLRPVSRLGLDQRGLGEGAPVETDWRDAGSRMAPRGL